MGKRGQINPQFGMTDAAFFGKIRSDLRKRWMYSEAYKQAIQRAKIEHKEGRKFYKVKCYQCEALYDLGEKLAITGKNGKVKAVVAYQVDHIDECGTLKSFADISPFADRLFTGRQEVLCHFCHERKHG